MKIAIKNTGKLLTVVLFTVLTFVNAKAQSHNKAAANCVYHEDYLKATAKTKNAVSCVDCYCKVCGDRKEKEKQAKLKAEKTALEQKTKGATSQKNTPKTPAKPKSNEAILVAPAPKVSSNIEKEPQTTAEPKKENKPIAEKKGVVDKNKIEMLLNEIRDMYASNKNFHMDNRILYELNFSGTKVTINKTEKAYTLDYKFYTYTFDLANIKDIRQSYYQDLGIYIQGKIDYELASGGKIKERAEIKSKKTTEETDKIYITSADSDYRKQVVYREANNKVMALLKQAALEAGATLQ